MNAKSYVTRRATKSGSWYESNSAVLSSQLNDWLSAADVCRDCSDTSPVKAVIAPHAGYSYSGPIAAFAYVNIKHVRAK